MLSIFNKHRYWAVLFFLVSAVLFWLATIFMTNPVNASLVPSKNQWIGFGIVVVIAIAAWIGRCYTIRPEKMA